MASKPWRDIWEVVGDLSSGGHGYTHKVRRREGADSSLYVLKTLKHQQSLERRARLYAEAAALRTLDHPGIAHLVDTNSDAYPDVSIPLYIVTQYIDGTPMSLLGVPVSPEDACASLDAILDALAFCHQRGHLHRDLKPDNVILRGGNVREPVLIDFGQTFNADTPVTGFETETGQQLGNRFLSLPELMTSGADKRNQLSDISFCVGLLFFLMTGRKPEALRDHQQRRPDEREPARQQLSQLPNPQRRELTRIFTVGFSTEFEHRWQSIAELRDAIKRVVASESDRAAISFAERVKSIKQVMAESPEHAIRSQFADLHAKLSAHIQNSVQVFRAELQPIIQVTHGGNALNAQEGKGTFQLRFHHSQFGKELLMDLEWKRAAARVVVSGAINPIRGLFRTPQETEGEGIELQKVNLSDPQMLQTLQDAIDTFLADQVVRWLEGLASGGAPS
jgi:serine/threonine protein kinase